jgi:hypothetical protein
MHLSADKFFFRHQSDTMATRRNGALLTFPFSGQKDQLKSLAEEITNQAFERINKLN